MEPRHLLAELERRIQPRTPLRIFWLAIRSERDAFAADVSKMSIDQSVFPWVLRAPGFSDPNAVMNDVVSVLEEARTGIEALGEKIREKEGLVLLILGRRELNLAVTSSPVQLPDWFPISPRQTVTARIEDLTWTIGVDLRDETLALGELNRILFEIEVEVVTRLQDNWGKDHRRVQPFWDHIRRKEDGNGFRDELHYIQGVLDGVLNPSAYRPSTRGRTIVSRIWYFVNTNPPDGLLKCSRALSTALGVELTEGSRRETLISALSRPSNPINSPDDRWVFALFVTIRSACQMITAAAHADEYPRFSFSLLRSTSIDIKEFLDGAIVVLRR